MKPKTIYLTLLFSFFLCLNALSGQSKNTNYVEIGLGFHSFYLPGLKSKFKLSQPAVMVGFYKKFSINSPFSAGFNIGYQKNKYQGDALYLQTQIRYHPTLFKSIVPEIGIGAGYQVSFRPNGSMEWNGNEWQEGNTRNGMFQAPIRISIGYKNQNGRLHNCTPFLAFQSNVLFGYNPDLSPLPSSNLLAGIKYNYHN